MMPSAVAKTLVVCGWPEVCEAGCGDPVCCCGEVEPGPVAPACGCGGGLAEEDLEGVVGGCGVAGDDLCGVWVDCADAGEGEGGCGVEQGDAARSRTAARRRLLMAMLAAVTARDFVGRPRASAAKALGRRTRKRLRARAG